MSHGNYQSTHLTSQKKEGLIITIIIIDFLTSQLWLGNIRLPWDVVISRIRLGGLTCSLKCFLQLNMYQELQIFAVVYMYSGAG